MSNSIAEPHAAFAFSLFQFLAFSTHGLHGGHQGRDVNADQRAFAGPALDFQVEIGAVQDVQALAHVAQSDAFDVHMRHFLFGDTHAVVFNFDVQPAVMRGGPQLNFSAAELGRKTVLQTILHNWLEEHAGDKGLEGLFAELLDDFEIVSAKAGHLDVQVIVDELQFFAERDEGLMLTEEPPQNIAQFQNHAARRIRINADQRRNGVERIEQKVRIDLAGERVHSGFQQKLLMTLEVHLDARVVPDFQRGSDRHQRRNHYQPQPPVPVGIDRKEPL